MYTSQQIYSKEERRVAFLCIWAYLEVCVTVLMSVKRKTVSTPAIMDYKELTRGREETLLPGRTSTSSLDPERCYCWSHKDQRAGVDLEQYVPVTPCLYERLHALLEDYFPSAYPVSLLLLHMVQIEYTLQEATPQHRLYHAPAGFMSQLLTNIRRVIRVNDEILTDREAGAALILPGVDQPGAYSVLERVYNSVNLLQAETVIPPLTRETHILFGYASYPQQSTQLDQLLDNASIQARSLVLRPILNIQATTNVLAEEPASKKKSVRETVARSRRTVGSGIPFLQLPDAVPAQLQALVPYVLALQWQCVPVGRDHQRLTVALADPLNSSVIEDLAAHTGMTIFPVACSEQDLDALLKKGW